MATAAFNYGALPVFDMFERVGDPSIYTPLPDDWLVGVADVVKSTEALAAGRYKAVNMAGAAVVGALRNALGPTPFPFVFGGDGAVVAVPSTAAATARDILAATAIFVREQLELELRVGAISVADIRAAGHDLRVARYAASPEAVYAMFSGGGASFAERELKAGRLTLEPPPPGVSADLSGLSCRWAPLQAQNGLILSLIVMPAEGADPAAFRGVAESVVRITQEQERGGHPVPKEGPSFAFAVGGMQMESAISRKWSSSRPVRFIRIGVEMALAVAANALGRKIGGFDARTYRKYVAMNSDFRKYDDGLRMTVDCSAQTADRIERLLAGAAAKGVVEYGLHRQDAALMTCIVPSALSHDHAHFLDGAGGGYALAAKELKQRVAGRATGPGENRTGPVDKS